MGSIINQSHHGADKTCALISPIPADGLSQVGCHEGADDTEQGRDDEAARSRPGVSNLATTPCQKPNDDWRSVARAVAFADFAAAAMRAWSGLPASSRGLPRPHARSLGNGQSGFRARAETGWGLRCPVWFTDRYTKALRP